MREDLKALSIKRAKEMIENLESGGTEKAKEFLPIYNRITGKSEKGSCSGCWAARVKLLKKTIEAIEKRDGILEVLEEAVGVKNEEVKVEPENETVTPPAKKRRGRPKSKK